MSISIIGVGGAGGNIADEAVKCGFLSGAINFSQRDLDSLENVELKLKLKGSEGVGHNRDEAIRLMKDKDNWEMALNFVKENFDNPSTDIIIVAFSTGGGSGCGISPMLIDILSNATDKTIVALPIIPDKSESIISQTNCLKAFEELSGIDVSIFPIDNEKCKSVGMPKNLIYRNTNESFIGILKSLYSYTDKFSKNGNLDKKDLITIFSTKGMGLIASAEIAKISTDNGTINITDDGFISSIHRSWDNSIFAFEKKQVIRAGVVFDGQENLMKFLDYERVFEPFSNGVLDLFEGNYHESNGRIITIMTGLSWCNTRLSETEMIIEEEKRSAEVALKNTENQAYQSKTFDFTSQIRKSNKKKSVSDILNKYNR